MSDALPSVIALGLSVSIVVLTEHVAPMLGEAVPTQSTGTLRSRSVVVPGQMLVVPHEILLAVFLRSVMRSRTASVRSGPEAFGL